MTIASGVSIRLAPQVSFPADRALDGLADALDGAWVWDAYCQAFGRPRALPRRIRIRQFSHSPGRGAILGYVVEWESDLYLPAENISLRLERGRDAEISRYPDDRNLPGLADAARPDSALGLVNRHVLRVPARQIRVDAVRYRPGSRAVLRHTIGQMTFYVRVVRPASAAILVSAAKRIVCSSFVAPRLAGYWDGGGVVWLSRIPGRNLRRYIRRGGRPDPDQLLDGLESLWGMSSDGESGDAFNLERRYRQAKRVLGHAARDDDELRDRVATAIRRLDPFVAAWRPSGMAHNDFYDDQMLELPDGRIALVDFEELGPGDPMLDIGNFLAHLRIQARLGSERIASAVDAYRTEFRSAALERLPWDEHELDLREAVCIFPNLHEHGSKYQFRLATSTGRRIVAGERSTRLTHESAQPRRTVGQPI